LFFTLLKHHVLYLLVFVFICWETTPVWAQSKDALRYEIDAKRVGISYTSRDALPRGREFRRIDSTYYVGWMLEGSYRYHHAADRNGYMNSAAILERAIRCMEMDFSKELKTRSQDIFTYLNVIKYHRDWDYTSFILLQCYFNSEQVYKAWELLQKCKRMNLQDEYFMDTYNYMAWLIHRNRFYTTRHYRFLKNSIQENEKMANRYLDSAASKIRRDAVLNTPFYGDGFEKERMPSVWHYKSILYTYQLEIASGQRYYDLLRTTRYFPLNNYATFLLIQGRFAEAESYYEKALKEDSGDKRLNESQYYLSVLGTYKNRNEEAITRLKALISANGSTPGYGWYNLALARNCLYRGLTEEAENYLKQAAEFREVHIGTTLGQSHYDFTRLLLQFHVQKRRADELRFLQPKWYLSPALIIEMVGLQVEKYSTAYLLLDQFASNPERDQVIYRLFSTESTVSFDEVCELIYELSPAYFIRKYEQLLPMEKRKGVKPYLQYILARLYEKQEEFHKALHIYSELKTCGDCFSYNVLFKSRIDEHEWLCRKALGLDDHVKEIARNWFQLYPQRIPGSGFRVPVYLNTNAQSKEQKEICRQLKECAIDFTSSPEKGILTLHVIFRNQGKIPVMAVSTSLERKERLIPVQDAGECVKQIIRILFSMTLSTT